MIFKGFAACLACAVAIWCARYVYKGSLASPNRCAMTYMNPAYDPLPVALPHGYRIIHYRDRPDITPPTHGSAAAKVTPVLFVPGNAGSFRQVRSLGRVGMIRAAEPGAHPLAFYALDQREEYSAVHPRVLWDQVDAVREAAAHIQQIHGGRPLIYVGHSMGGCVAAVAAFGDKGRINSSSIAGFIALSTPFTAPAFEHEPEAAEFGKLVRQALQAAPSTVPIVSLAGGERDAMVPAARCDIGTNADGTRLSLTTASVPGVWVHNDHQCITWCRQVMEALADALQALAGPKCKAGQLLRTRLVSALPDMFLNSTLPRTKPVTSEEESTAATAKTPTRLPLVVQAHHGAVLVDIDTLREQWHSNLLLRASISASAVAPAVVLCGDLEHMCTSITPSWEQLPSKDDKGRKYTHIMWLDSVALRPFKRLYVRVKAKDDRVLVQDFEDPIVVEAFSKTSRLSAQPGDVLHIKASELFASNAYKLELSAGSGPHVAVAIRTPLEPARHAKELIVDFVQDGEVLNLTGTNAARSLDVFVIPAAAMSAALANEAYKPLVAQLHLHLEAMLGRLFRLYQFDAVWFAFLFLLLARSERNLERHTVVTLLFVLFVVRMEHALHSRPLHHTLFLCVLGMAYAAALWLVAQVLTFVVSVVSPVDEYNRRQRKKVNKYIVLFLAMVAMVAATAHVAQPLALAVVLLLLLARVFMSKLESVRASLADVLAVLLVPLGFAVLELVASRPWTMDKLARNFAGRGACAAELATLAAALHGLVWPQGPLTGKQMPAVAKCLAICAVQYARVSLGYEALCWAAPIALFTMLLV